MENVVYVDVLFLVNLIIDTLLLTATAYFRKKQISKLRLFIAATVGSLYAVFAFLTEINQVLCFLLDIGIAALMILFCFKFKNKIDYIKDVLVLFITSFIFGGCVMGLYFFTSAGKIITLNNGVFYFDISAPVLFLFAAISYVLVIVLSKTFSENKTTSFMADVEIFFSGNSVKLIGFTDTGNSVIDIITGLPVIIAEFDSVKAIIPMEMYSLCSANNAKVYNQVTESEIISKIRVVPYRGVLNDCGLLTCIKPDKVIITQKGKTYKPDVLVGIINEKMTMTDRYQVLLNTEIFS